MYQQPPPYAPPPYSPPTSIKVLGIMNLVFAGLGVIGLLFTWGMYFGDMKLGPRNPVVELAHGSSGYMTFMKWSVIVGGFALVALATSGIGMLMLKRWAHKLAIVYGVYGIVSSIVGLAVTYHYILGPLSKSRDAVAGAGMMGGFLGGILGTIYPLILLIFMLRRNVREAFTRAAEPPLPPARIVQ